MRSWAAPLVLRLAGSSLMLLAACGRRSGNDTAGTAGGPPPPSLQVLSGVTETGVLQHPIRVDSSPGPYIQGDEIYADAQAVATAIFLGTVVGVQENHLTLDGRPTGIPARLHGSTVYAPVRALARELGAYADVRQGDPPVVTLWPAPVLCDYRRQADTAEAVYRAAQAQDLFAGCRR